VCAECFREHYIQCQGSQVAVLKTDAVTTEDGFHLSRTWAEEHAFRCVGSGLWFYRRSAMVETAPVNGQAAFVSINYTRRHSWVLCRDRKWYPKDAQPSFEHLPRLDYRRPADTIQEWERERTSAAAMDRWGCDDHAYAYSWQLRAYISGHELKALYDEGRQVVPLDIQTRDVEFFTRNPVYSWNCAFYSWPDVNEAYNEHHRAKRAAREAARSGEDRMRRPDVWEDVAALAEGTTTRRRDAA
jgi:hypothetical protein